jgi:TonB family protein
MTTHGIAFGVFLLCAVVTASTAADAAGCDALDAAMSKFNHTPHRDDVTVLSREGRGTIHFPTKTIFTGDKLYSWFEGTWTVTSTSGDTIEQNINASRKGSTRSCNPEGTEMVAGEPADVFVEDENTLNGFLSVGRFWISRRSGLPLKSELLLAKTDGGSTIAMLTTATADAYDDIRPPPGLEHLSVAPPPADDIPLIDPLYERGGMSAAKIDQSRPHAVQAPPGGGTGKVLLILTIDASGVVTSAIVEGSSGSADLDQAAVSSVLAWHILPARRDNTEIASRRRLAIDFGPVPLP